MPRSTTKSERPLKGEGASLFDAVGQPPQMEIDSIPENIKAIGFRAESQAINWAIVMRGGDNLILVAKDTQDIPATFDESRGLEWCRKRFHQIIDEHLPSFAGVRYPEPSARKSNVAGANKRVRIEGVILESLASKGVEIVTGALATIGSILGSKDPKGYLKRDDLRGLKWKGIPLNRKEAILVAVAALTHARKAKSHGNKK